MTYAHLFLITLMLSACAKHGNGLHDLYPVSEELPTIECPREKEPDFTIPDQPPDNTIDQEGLLAEIDRLQKTVVVCEDTNSSLSEQVNLLTIKVAELEAELEKKDKK